MVLAIFQYSYRTLTWGAGTDFGNVTAEFETIGPVETTDAARTRLDGSFTGLDMNRTRTATFDFAIPSVGDGSTYPTNRELWSRTFAPVISQALPLSALIPDWAATGGARRLYARPRKRSQPEDSISSTSLSSWSVQLEAPDPLWYADTATTVAAASTITIPNAGNWPGPGPTPGVTTLTISAASTLTTSNGGSIAFTGTGPWTIDLATHIVTGGAGYIDMTQPSQFFLVDPGGITATVTAGTVAATTRSSWD